MFNVNKNWNADIFRHHSRSKKRFGWLFRRHGMFSCLEEPWAFRDCMGWPQDSHRKYHWMTPDGWSLGHLGPWGHFRPWTYWIWGIIIIMGLIEFASAWNSFRRICSIMRPKLRNRSLSGALVVAPIGKFEYGKHLTVFLK